MSTPRALASVNRIAAAASANKAILYTYFGNKEQLFDAVFAAMVAAASDGSPSTRTTCPATQPPCSTATAPTSTRRG
jgi:hypothetical protein